MSKKEKWIWLITKPSLNVKMLKSFENDLGKVSQTAFPNFRCFISSESPLLHNIDIIPEPIVSRRKFGDICRSTKYKFNEGDLQIVQM